MSHFGYPDPTYESYRPDYSRDSDRSGAWSPRAPPRAPRSAQRLPHQARHANHDQYSGMSPIKRKPSRSPEGASPQKKTPRNNSVSTGNSDSRKNSSANATHIDASADPRQNRGPISNAVRSPVSTDGSTYQDATSSRSTFRPTNLKASSAVPNSHDEGNAGDANDADMNPLLDVVSALLTHVAAEGCLQVSHKVAKSRLETATADYHGMESLFKKFPAIEERLTGDKTAADREVAKLSQQLKVNVGARSSLARSLTGAISNIMSRSENARRVPEISPDAVSRHEFEDLKDVFAKQQILLEKQQDQFAKQQDLFDKQQQQLEKLENSHAEAKKAALEAREQANTTERDTIRDFAKLETLVQKTETSVRSDIDHIRGQMQPQLDNAIQTADGARLAVDKHGTAVAGITKQLDAQCNVINQLSNTLGCTTHTVSKMEERLTATTNQVGQIRAKVSSNIDNEQMVLMQRLEAYDQKLDDLQKLMQSSRGENARVIQLEKVHDDLAQDVQQVENAPKPITLAHKNDQAVEAFMAHVEEKFTAVDAEIVILKTETKADADLRDGILGDAQDALEKSHEQTKDLLASLSERVDGLDELSQLIRACSSRIQKLEQSTDDKHLQTSAASAAIRDTPKIIRSTFEELEKRITSLTETVAALEKRPVAVPNPQTLAPAPAAVPTSAQDMTQFRPVSTQSPFAPHARHSRPGSISGNVQMNGVRSPINTTSPFGVPDGAPPSPNLRSRDIAVLAEQNKGIQGMIHSLKQRMDNLTTEEVVRGMIDQMGKMYPAPKEFQAAVMALQAADERLEGRLGAFDTKANVLHADLADLRRKFDELATKLVEDGQRTSKVYEAVTLLRKDVEVTIGNAKKQLDHAVDLQTDVIVEVKHQVQALADAAWGPSDD